MRKVNADLHNHLKTGSDMSTIGFNQVIDLARKRLGPGGILGVINFLDNRYEQFADKEGYERQDLGCGLYVPEKEILVIKGEEVATKQGHLLVLGLRKNQHLQHGKDLEETINEATKENGIVVADHPFIAVGLGKQIQGTQDTEGVISYPSSLERLDAIEVHNGEAALVSSANKRAQEFFRRMGHFYQRPGALISSDGHSLREIGSSYTTLNMPDYNEITSSDLLIDNLRKAIQGHKDFSGKMTNARLMALAHLFSLIGYILKEKFYVFVKRISNK